MVRKWNFNLFTNLKINIQFCGFSVGLDALNGFQENLTHKTPSPNGKLPNDDASIPMEIDDDVTANDIQSATNDASTVPQVDLESELREFLESDTTSLAAADEIDQILLA